MQKARPRASGIFQIRRVIDAAAIDIVADHIDAHAPTHAVERRPASVARGVDEVHAARARELQGREGQHEPAVLRERARIADGHPEGAGRERLAGGQLPLQVPKRHGFAGLADGGMSPRHPPQALGEAEGDPALRRGLRDGDVNQGAARLPPIQPHPLGQLGGTVVLHVPDLQVRGLRASKLADRNGSLGRRRGRRGLGRGGRCGRRRRRGHKFRGGGRRRCRGCRSGCRRWCRRGRPRGRRGLRRGCLRRRLRVVIARVRDVGAP
mmetsp:Transcript_114420/g.319749  ORF Transcript_114420/g.319749 Transcript_114420/m.319749 type:complete len:266 (-) Transcript_114420:462-1259(-)